MLATAIRACVLESLPVHHSQLPLMAASGFGGGSLGPRCAGGTIRRGGDADPALDCRPDSRARCPHHISGSEKMFNAVDMLGCGSSRVGVLVKAVTLRVLGLCARVGANCSSTSRNTCSGLTTLAMSYATLHESQLAVSYGHDALLLIMGKLARSALDRVTPITRACVSQSGAGDRRA